MNSLQWLSDVLFYVAIVNLIVSATAVGLLTWASIITRRLIDVPPAHVTAGLPVLARSPDHASPPDRRSPGPSNLPSVSLIAPARNEQRNIERAVRSLMKLDYPSLEITLVNDRSTDRTGEILDRLAHEFPQLNVIHLTDLPAGWLGKNHALQYGATRSSGDWLLFTDADVVFDPTALRRAIHYAESNKVDHLVATPDCHMPSWLLTSFAVTFAMYFSLYCRLWAIRWPWSRAHIGIGAFNLIRTGVYKAIGGHETIRMRPDDDLKLGKVIKLAGYRQDVVNGTKMITLDWYSSLGETIRGLEKNAFSGADYRIGLTVFSSAVSLAFNVWPFLAVFLLPGPVRWLYATICLTLLYGAWQSARGMNARPSTALGFPLGVLLLVYIQWRTMLLNYYQNGIHWRDTHYSLAELKANKV